MRYRTQEAFRAALDQRLKNDAAERGVTLMRLRKRVAFERFLARVSAAEAAGWLLKGAFALDMRLGLATRATKDIDLGVADDEDAATAQLMRAASLDLGAPSAVSLRRSIERRRSTHRRTEVGPNQASALGPSQASAATAAPSLAGSWPRSSGDPVGSSLLSPFSSGSRHQRHDQGHDAHAAPPFRRRQAHRSVRFSAQPLATEAGDECREDPAGRW